MSRRKAHHVISDSEEEEENDAPTTTSQAKDSDDESNDDKSSSQKKKSTNRRAVVPREDAVAGFDEESVAVSRTPVSFKVVEVAQRPSRKAQSKMSAYVIDRSPSSTENLETYVPYIVKRRLADNFMKMKFETTTQQHILVMTCCDSRTENMSNQEQAKKINEHCVELVSSGMVTVAKITKISEVSDEIKAEEEQHSNVMAGLLTAADIINRLSQEHDAYIETELMLFSDLNFDQTDSSVVKVQKVLGKVLPTAKLVIVSDRDRLESEEYISNLDFLKSTCADFEHTSYQDAMKRSEQWTMKEQIPTKFNASIKFFDQTLPTEAYLVCNEKNVSILENRLEKLDDETDALELSEGFLRHKKELVKLTDDGHYEKDGDGKIVVVDQERTSMAFRFGTTAVPSEKKLKDYITQKDSHKGYVVKGWYPIDQFPNYVKGGSAYRVFSPVDDPTTFDSLLKLCALRNRALLVDYSYATRFESKPGVLIPHLTKHCFVFYELIYGDNVNYLPRYDPITTGKPDVEDIKRMAEIIGESKVASLEMKYDPQSQQIFENLWENKIDEMSKKFVDKLAEVKIEKKSALSIEAKNFKDKAEGFLKRLTVSRKNEASDDNDDKIAFHVEALDEKQIEIINPDEYDSLFA